MLKIVGGTESRDTLLQRLAVLEQENAKLRAEFARLKMALRDAGYYFAMD